MAAMLLLLELDTIAIKVVYKLCVVIRLTSLNVSEKLDITTFMNPGVIVYFKHVL